MREPMARYPSLDERVVFVTGGGGGIGAALVKAFHHQGARVAFVDIDDAASQTLCRDLEAQTGRAPDYHRCDIRDIAALQAVIDQVSERHGPIRTLINNAANDDRHDWRDVSVDYWDERMSLNLRPMFFSSQAVAERMAQAGGGSIINFGSISVRLALGNLPTYVTAKSAVHGLTRSLARDLGEQNIRVNTVVPGCIMTERQLDKWIGPEDEARIQQHQCLKVRLAPEHVAPMVLFLAADDSAQLTGQEFPVDAGWG
ncbi:NAD(P)-dependent dehydrogenase, short-chain alcohol dehydrogenase family [Franzmannia pantelleriensis]|uniref:NAD(P)-dependent dehydrogenase, short-chain alcohol dehydrogenase family n=1 Tax=Franzmannia pantelleriensis TaxID=48727 RepID=A0A1G9UL10_9GAMM|nr:SDR family oxidoreductase [Halomonas pantelleriensis]SDM60543.1 NAD(P)-dependent dehydrogenase, short-chain alcohol dehydrogenase family [Halomonas pantelleriensis]